ncbi:hypothetical protein [Flavobacterium panacagri]|uniref:hypothetical protein n=1 Tax=Flavobacterium panacagri TaxID=3034146 RepID=UPI0025A59360|nr:hypothetical protein [Flavobacterium panacagri]
MEIVKHLINSITQKGLEPSINLDRPNYVQPEDRIQFRAMRLIIILGKLNTDNGLSKEIISCVDFLLRNEHFQTKFILEYYAGKKNVLNKLNTIEKTNQIEIDFNIVQYKSVPWDLRFNDMLMYLFIRDLIDYKVDKDNKNTRIKLSDQGIKSFNLLESIFPSEVNFLSLFGKRMDTNKTIKIITEIIPNSYWKQNAEIDY